MARIICFYFGTSIALSTFVFFGKGVVLDCYNTTPYKYDGHQQKTAKGDECVRWDSFSHSYKNPSKFPDATLSDAANYCRNPSKGSYIWCYTGTAFSSLNWGKCGIQKCKSSDTINQCGTLSIERPTILGRNVTFIFTPDTNDPEAILEWQRTNKVNRWATLPFKFKFTQSYHDGTYYLTLTDTVRGNDELFYRVHYYNESMHCLMETPKLVLQTSINQCGTLSIEQPTILGRNVTFTFNPDTNDPEAILEWQRTNKVNRWATLPFEYKFTQSYRDGTFYLTLTETVRGNDEIFYRVHFYSKNIHCFMETPKLVLHNISKESCGFVYSRTNKVLLNEYAELEYYPSKNVIDDPEKFARQWTVSTNQMAVPVEMTTGVYKEESRPNNKYVLTIFMVNDSMSGEYAVDCGETAGNSNTADVILLVPPSAPVFEGLKDVDDCKGCIVGEDGDQFRVLCKTSGGTQPVIVTMSIGNESCSSGRYNDTSAGYLAYFILLDKHHMAIMKCTVSNDALAAPLITTARVYVIKSATFQSFVVPEILKETDYVNITCILNSGRPAPNVYFNISGTEVSSANLTNNFNSSTYIVLLTTFERKWNRESIRCCRFNEWYRNASVCSQPKQITYLFPPSKLNIEVRFIEFSHEVHAVCTLYDSNPPCEAIFSASGGVIASNRYNKTISRAHDAWDTEHAVNLNVNKEHNGEIIKCEASCADFPDGRNEKKVITLPYAPTIEFNTSGLVLNISEGETAHVKCSAESVPVSNISWVKQTDVGNITIKHCPLQADCVIAIDVHSISQRDFICRAHYLQDTKQKVLKVNNFAEDVKGYSGKQNPGFNWIFVGCSLSAVVVVLFIVGLIGRKIQINRKAKHEATPAGNSGGGEARGIEGEPEVHLQEYLNDNSGQSEVTYAQPNKIKRKPSVDAMQPDTDQTGNPNSPANCSKEKQPAQDGHLLYVELDFDSTSVPPKSKIAKRRNTPTEYVDIDFVKTASEKTEENELSEMENVYANQ